MLLKLMLFRPKAVKQVLELPKEMHKVEWNGMLHEYFECVHAWLCKVS